MRGATEREERPTSWACLGKRAATAWQSQPNAGGGGDYGGGSQGPALSVSFEGHTALWGTQGSPP